MLLTVPNPATNHVRRFGYRPPSPPWTDPARSISRRYVIAILACAAAGRDAKDAKAPTPAYLYVDTNLDLEINRQAAFSETIVWNKLQPTVGAHWPIWMPAAIDVAGDFAVSVPTLQLMPYEVSFAREKPSGPTTPELPKSSASIPGPF